MGASIGGHKVTKIAIEQAVCAVQQGPIQCNGASFGWSPANYFGFQIKGHWVCGRQRMDGRISESEELRYGSGTLHTFRVGAFQILAPFASELHLAAWPLRIALSFTFCP